VWRRRSDGTWKLKLLDAGSNGTALDMHQDPGQVGRVEDGHGARFAFCQRT
jgi:hypothetical protein